MISDQEILDAVSGAVRSGRGVAIPVSGRSMGPEFANVRNIVVKPFSPAAIRLGSIIAFQQNGRWIVHRVMWKFGRVENAFCITKGDNAGQLDQPYVQASDIQGLVVGLDMIEGVTINLTSTYRRLAGVAMVARGWLIVGLAHLRRSRPPSRP